MRNRGYFLDLSNFDRAKRGYDDGKTGECDEEFLEHRWMIKKIWCKIYEDADSTGAVAVNSLADCKIFVSSATNVLRSVSESGAIKRAII